MDNNTADYIRLLAERYETADFLKDDPSLFMHKVETAADREVMAFAASCLSYGSRKQFFPKIQYYNRENEMCIFSKRNVHFLYFFSRFPSSFLMGF